MRVYDLAKQLDMANKDLMDKIKELGIDVKSHSSSLDDKQVRQILDSTGKKVDLHKVESPHVKDEKKIISEAKPPVKEVAPPPPPPKPPLDARAKAMEAIARAKERAALERHKAAESAASQGEGEPSEVKAPTPQEVDLGPKKAVLKAPEHQTVAVPSAQPAAAPAPKAEAAPATPAAPKRMEQPKVAAPSAPVPKGRERERERERETPPRQQQSHQKPEFPSGPSMRRPVELQQLPSLPRSRSSARRGAKEDLVVPAIEVMKLRPPRRGAPPKRAPEKVSEEETAAAPQTGCGQDTGSRRKENPAGPFPQSR